MILKTVLEPSQACSSSDKAANLDSIEQVLAEVESLVPPLWPLRDYVAVNPFLGWTDQTFLEVRSRVRAVRDCEMLPPWSYFQAVLARNEILPEDVALALRRCASEYPDWQPESFTLAEKDSALADLESIVGQLGEPINPARIADQASSGRRYFTVSEAVDRRQASRWASHFINDVTRHCAAHFDQGQAAWTNPWKDETLYEAWRDAATRSRRLDLLGVRGFRTLVNQLPKSPVAAIAVLLEHLGIPDRHWQPFLMCELFSVYGWACYVKYRVREAEAEGRRDDDLIGLLAMRLTYDVALGHLHNTRWQELCPPDETPAPVATQDARARYALMTAQEVAWQRRLCSAIDANMARSSQHHAADPPRKAAQMVFCIDVRSEVLRRHLEAIDDSIETFGFAGFFGMAFEFERLGETDGGSQCPVLLRPAFKVQEDVEGATDAEADAIVHARFVRRASRKLWKAFQTSASSCFSFVESLGTLYGFKLLTDSFRLTRPVASADHDGLPAGGNRILRPRIPVEGEAGLTHEKQVELAAGMLRNLGLTEGFAPIVIICGHEADVVNNPFKAGLACGACGGHSGEVNARVAARLLNEPTIRASLAERGTRIPADTWFVAAVHRTTTDTMLFSDSDQIPTELTSQFRQVEAWVKRAGEQCRAERSRRLRGSDPVDLLRRSRDWAEVRPEWGLAGNAAFIVAPRERTRGLKLDGRTFMHSYDHRRDPGSKVLELIMTAPMIVTNWINLQYFASTVDNEAFGAGNKLIHNVVGQFGVLEGNGGDLKTGLPWQSVHDGEEFQHQPLRLLVLIEAPREAVRDILDRNPSVCDLVSNGWLSLVVHDEGRWHRWHRAGHWRVETTAPTASAATPGVIPACSNAKGNGRFCGDSHSAS